MILKKNITKLSRKILRKGFNTLATVLQEFVQILVSGIVQLATGIAGGVVAMAKALFLEINTETGVVTGLSMFGGIIAIFAGLALAVSITTRVYTWVTSLGN